MTENGKSWDTLDTLSIISMNLWGCTPAMLEKLKEPVTNWTVGCLRTYLNDIAGLWMPDCNKVADFPC